LTLLESKTRASKFVYCDPIQKYRGRRTKKAKGVSEGTGRLANNIKRRRKARRKKRKLGGTKEERKGKTGFPKKKISKTKDAKSASRQKWGSRRNRGRGQGMEERRKE